MGLAHPRPAMRLGGREDRIIRARLRYYDTRKRELEAHGMLEPDASAQAYQEARHLKFTRDGKLKS